MDKYVFSVSWNIQLQYANLANGIWRFSLTLLTARQVILAMLSFIKNDFNISG